MAHGNLHVCLPTILANEGGFSLLHNDPGNWTGGKVGRGELKGTNMGIAASAHPGLDIAHLTKSQVEAIYERDYWLPAGCEDLPPGLDLSHLDGTVNSGRRNSSRWLRAASNGDTSDRIHAYAAARLRSLRSWRIWATFGKGISARVARVEAKSLEMALGPVAPAMIAEAGARAATKAKAASVVAHAGTAAAGSSVAIGAATNHLWIGVAAGVVFVLGALWCAFHASTSSARAAGLAAQETPQETPTMIRGPETGQRDYLRGS